MHWLPLALTCALAIASADAFTKRYLPDYSGRDLVVIRFGLPGLLLLPVALINPLPPVPAEFWLWIVALVPLELLAMLLYMLAIRDSPLHLTLPYLAFTPVFNVLTGWLVLGESVSLEGFSGIVLVVLGAYWLNLGRPDSGSGRWLAPVAAIAHERGSRLMLAVAAIYSLTSVMGKGAMQYATPETFGAFYYAVIGMIVLVFVGIRRPSNLRIVFKRPAAHLWVGILMAVMVVTHFLAIARVEVAYMVSVKRTSLLFGIIYGALLFGERHVARHMAAGAVMVGGVALILL